MGSFELLSFDNRGLDSLLICRGKDNMATEIEGDVVLLDLASNAFVGLDAIGSVVWEHLHEPISFQGLCLLLMERYDVAEDVCRTDVLEFLQELSAGNLIVVCE